AGVIGGNDTSCCTYDCATINLNIFVDTSSNVICNGANDGFVNAHSLTCTIWEWLDNSSNVANRQNMAPGAYTLVAMSCDSNCFDTLNITITEPTAITSTMAIIHETIVGANDGQIDITVSGGTPCATSVTVCYNCNTIAQTYLQRMWYTYYHDGKTQLTYEAAELAALGISTGDIIDEIGWNILSQDGAASTTPMTNANLTINGTNVWSGTHQAVLGMNNFVFSTPITYIGGDLVVEWCFDNSSYLMGNNYFESSFMGPTGANLCISEYADFAVGCALTNLMSWSNDRPNAYIGFQASSGYTYAWDNGDTTEDISGLSAGQYCVTITDCYNCSVSFCDSVMVALTPGCTDSTALNYNQFATIDDSSCIYCVYGCTDPNAANYDSSATCDDGSCFFYCCNSAWSGTVVAPTAGTVTITTCVALNQYSSITSAVGGATYTCEITGSQANPGFIVIYEGTSCGNFVTMGSSPLSWTAPTSGNYFAHWLADSSCATATG
ncbi:uncharacterized protein METZ01_LOCUS227200, partial [marine metagenome]